MTDDLIQVSTLDNVTTVIINRPDKANSLTPDMLLQLRDVFLELADEHAPQAVIVRGAGDRVFCAGADLNTLYDENDGSNPWYEMTEALRNIPVLTIAAINGPCIGGGLSLALACDVRLAVTDARFSYPVLKNKVLPGQYDVETLLRLVGPGKTSMLLLSAVDVFSQEALAWGLVDRVVSREQLESACRDLCATPAASDSTHQRQLKSMLRVSSI